MKNFINIGIVALRKPNGEPLEARPIYISPDDGNISSDDIKHIATRLAEMHKAQSKKGAANG
jgi:hypothetical protein